MTKPTLRVLVIADVLDNCIQDTTHELIGAALQLTDSGTVDIEINTVVYGSAIAEEAEKLLYTGVKKVLVVEDEALLHFHDEILSEHIVRIVKKYDPDIVLGSAGGRGRSFLPRIATSLGTGMTADCTELAIEPETGFLLQTRPAFGGNLIATIKTADHRPQMATVRPGLFEKCATSSEKSGSLVTEQHDIDAKYSLKKILKEVIEDGQSRSNFDNAHVVITGGRGCKNEQGFGLLKEFADLVNGALGATRAAVDHGWVHHEHQIGQTGMTVRAKVYFAIGVSGQIQHLVGMKDCECIIAINNDPEAPIFKLADIAIVGDLFEVVPEIIKYLKETLHVREFTK